MGKNYHEINGKVQKCVIWNLKEFAEKFKPNEWKREWSGKDFLDKLKLSPPNEFISVSGSGLYVKLDEKTQRKEVYGVDVFRKDDHGKTKISVYHYPFYKEKNKVFMPIKPLKLNGEHHVKDIPEFEEKHDESNNYNFI